MEVIGAPEGCQLNGREKAGCSHACSLRDGNPFLTREPHAPLNYAMKVV